MLRRFFFVFEAHDFHHFSPFSPLSHLHLLFSPLRSSPLLSSPLLCSPLLFSSLLFSVVFRCLCCGRLFRVLCCCRLFFSVLCHCFCCSFVVAASAVAARVAGASSVFLSGYFSFWVDFSFCLFSLSFRPLLSSCQVHSARRVACT